MGSGGLGALVQALRVPSFRRSSMPATTDPSSLPQAGAPAAEQEAIGRFHQELAWRVQHLQLQGGSAQLSWLLDACASTISTHFSLASVLCIHPSSHRADDVLSLLYACTSLRQAADDVGRQLSLLQMVLLRAGSSIAKPSGRLATTRRLRACLHGFHAIIGAEYSPLAKAQASLRLAAKREVLAASHSLHPHHLAVDGTLLMSLLVLASAAASFAPPIKSTRAATRRTCKRIATHVANISPTRSSTGFVAWTAPLCQLQCDLKEDEMSALFNEIQRIQAAIRSLHKAVDSPSQQCSSNTCRELQQRMDSLWKLAGEAQTCVAMLSSNFDALFQALLSLRLALMGYF